MSDTRPMTAEQAATLKRLAKDAHELDAFKPNLTRAEADLRIAMLTAKLSSPEQNTSVMLAGRPPKLRSFVQASGLGRIIYRRIRASTV
jgi:hypothetical protein